MKQCLLVGAVTIGLLAPAYRVNAQALTPAQLALKAKVEGVPEISYEAVPNFLKLPDDLYFGESVGVATNSKGHTFVYDRGHRTRIFEFDQTGKFLHFVGDGLYGMVFAHIVRVDPQDNLWAVDEGSNMIMKFNPEGRISMVMGRRPESHGLLATPPNGAPQPPTDGEGNVYVGDRGNRRIQVFNNDGEFKTQYLNVGAPWAICISPGAHQYLFSSNSSGPGDMENGEIYKMELNGKIIGKFGTAGKLLKEFGSTHELDCRSPNEIVVGEITNWRVRKLTLHSN